VYYDHAMFNDFWAAAAALGKPFYMHPRDPLPSREPIYDGFPWLTGPRGRSPSKPASTRCA